MNHLWVSSTYGHGNKMCSKCGVTDLEAGVIGILNDCPVSEEKISAEKDMRTDADRVVWDDNPDE